MTSAGPGGRLRSTAAAALGTTVGSALGALLPFVLTRLSDLGRDTDVYFLVAGVAQLAAFMLSMVIESGSIPLAATALGAGPGRLTVFARAMTRYALLYAAVLTVGWVLVSAVVVSLADLSPVYERQAWVLVVAFLPFPVLVAVTSVFAAAQYAMGRFAGTTASLGLRAGGGMALALLADDGQRLVAAAVGLSVGEALRLVLLVLTLPRDAVPWRRGWGRAHEAGRTFLRTSSPTMAAALIVAVNPLIAKTIATRLGPGATTLIELAEKLFYIPMVLLVAAVSRVSATVWAHRVHDPEGLRADFWRVQRIGALVTAGVATAGAVVMLVGRPLVGSLLGLPADSPFALVFVLFIVGLPLALAGDLSGTMLITLRRTGVLPALAAVLVVVNLGTTVVGAQHLDVVGVALAGTVVRVLNAAALLYFAWGLLRAGTGPPADVSPAATRPAPPRTGPAGD